MWRLVRRAEPLPARMRPGPTEERIVEAFLASPANELGHRRAYWRPQVVPVDLDALLGDVSG